ncbi:MAG TPA: BamA/TamA family outer membrane protein [Flavobacteriales bacterium]|nr:BamA/TamA family outer membrane protein [Flavobacteriales bacterium]
MGEIRLEANFEYRFKLIGYLEGALFTDVGNIWNRRKDPLRPGVEFEFDDFLGELAVGAGAGARLNFDFFIIRFDLGMQTKDPALPEGERWLFQPKDRYISEQAALGNDVTYRTRFNFNLGIGYPF